MAGEAELTSQKLFTLEEARALLPHLRDLFQAAHAELGALHTRLEAANAAFAEAEKALGELDTSTCADDVAGLRACRQTYQKSIEALSAVQREYMESFEIWVDKITQTGVQLRDMRDGLLDFPCRRDDFYYLLCWRLSEADIGFWHLSTDGFAGRKPLTALVEYF